jgi:hypothetical protein
VGNKSHSRLSLPYPFPAVNTTLLYRFLVVAVALLVGVGIYVLVVTVFYTPKPTYGQHHSFPQVITQGTGPPPGLPTSPPPPRRTLCWQYKPSDVTVGEASAIEIILSACDGGDLPTNTTVQVFTPKSANVALSGPSETERTRTSQSWAWTASAHAVGDSEVLFQVSGCGLEPTEISENIDAHSPRPGQGRVAMAISTAISTGSPALQAIGGLLGAVAAVITAVATFAANRRGQATTKPAQPGQPAVAGAGTPNAVEDASKSRGADKAVEDASKSGDAGNPVQ